MGLKDRVRRIVLAGSYQYDFYAPAWKRALEALDVRVAVFDWSRFWSGRPLRRLEQRFLFGPALARINQALIEMVAEIDPDVVMIYAGHPIRPQTVQKLSRRFWVASYHNDDPFGRYGAKAFFRWFKESIPYYCSHHVYREKNLSDYTNLGVERVALLMSYYCPWLSYPVADGDTEGYPVVFVGNGEPGPRKDYITSLVERGVQVKLFGNDKYWKRYLPKEIHKRVSPIVPVTGEDYNAVISKAKISLAFFNSGNNDQYTRRVFEIPACRGFLLAQRTPVMERLYREGKEAEYFDSSEELADKIHYYLSHEEKRLAIAEAGHQRCITSGYDVYTRMRQWIEDTERWMKGGPCR